MPVSCFPNQSSGTKAEKVQVDIAFCCGICESVYENQWKFNEHFSLKHIKKEAEESKLQIIDVPVIYKNEHFEINEVKEEKELFSIDIKETKNFIHHRSKDDDQKFVGTDVKKAKNFVKKHGTMARCKICEKTSREVQDCIKHIRAVHFKHKPFHCTVCNKNFGTRSFLRIHEVIHQEHRIRSHHCNVCQKSFYSQKNLSSHMDIHRDVKRYKCEFCDWRFNHNWGLIIHRRSHLNDRPFSCDVCGYKCITSSDLKKHSVKHTKERKYVCQVCQKRFLRLNELTQHTRKHTKILIHCQYCNKGFINGHSRNKHEKTYHSGPKPFHCAICDLYFESLQENSLHEDVVHNKYRCDICGKSISQRGDLLKHMYLHLKIQCPRLHSSKKFSNRKNHKLQQKNC